MFFYAYFFFIILLTKIITNYNLMEKKQSMFASDTGLMSWVALATAKATYGALTILRRHMANDLDLALVAFAVIMRTRRDMFHSVELQILKKDIVVQTCTEPTFYTSINEISQHTNINRATVRRKMRKLVDLGMINKIDDDKWHWVDINVEEDLPATIMFRELLRNYFSTISKLEALLQENTLQENTMPLLSDLEASEAYALLESEVIRKTKRGLMVDQNPMGLKRASLAGVG